jgi:hypothetical protein
LGPVLSGSSGHQESGTYQPLADRGGYRRRISEGVIARNSDDDPLWAGGRHPKRIALSLHDERREGDRLELWKAALGGIVGTAWRMNRKRQAQHCDCSGLDCSSAGHARPGRAPACHERDTSEVLLAEFRDHLDPRAIKLARSGLRPATRHPVRLLQECHGEPRGSGRFR